MICPYRNERQIVHVTQKCHEHSSVILTSDLLIESENRNASRTIMCMKIYLVLWLVVLMFYGPSAHFRSFRTRSVNLATLFLGKPPWQFTST